MKTDENEFCLRPLKSEQFPKLILSFWNRYIYICGFLFNPVSALMGGVISARHIAMYCVALSQLFIKSQNNSLIIPILWLHEWRLRDLDHTEWRERNWDSTFKPDFLAPKPQSHVPTSSFPCIWFSSGFYVTMLIYAKISTPSWL